MMKVQPYTVLYYLFADDPEPEKYDDDINLLNDVAIENKAQLLDRGAREVLNQVEEALRHTDEERDVDVRQSSSENAVEVKNILLILYFTFCINFV